MDIKRVSDENLYGKPCGLNHCSVSVLFQFFLCTWEINSFICQSLTRCPLIINPIRKWFRVQGSRWAVPLPVYWCLVLWTVRTTERTRTGYSSQIWNPWRLQSYVLSVGNACILRFLLKVAWVYNKKRTHYVNKGSGRKGESKKKKRKGERRGWNKEAGQSERQESVAPASDSSIFNDALVPSCYTTLLPPPHLLSTLSTLKHTNPASCNSISLLPLPIVYFMDPLWSIKSCCFCQPPNCPMCLSFRPC